jgi:hypothetical protein
MPTQREIRDFQKQRQSMLCPACKKLNWKTHAQIMATDRFVGDRCGKPLPFDKENWRSEVFNPPRKSLDERINEKGRRAARPKRKQDA